MPTVAIVDGVKVQFFFADHAPPHFHVEFAGQRAMMRLGDLQLLYGTIPEAKLQAVRDWAATRREELAGCWDKASRSENPGKVG